MACVDSQNMENRLYFLPMDNMASSCQPSTLLLSKVFSQSVSRLTQEIRGKQHNSAEVCSGELPTFFKSTELSHPYLVNS